MRKKFYPLACVRGAVTERQKSTGGHSGVLVLQTSTSRRAPIAGQKAAQERGSPVCLMPQAARKGRGAKEKHQVAWGLLGFQRLCHLLETHPKKGKAGPIARV